MILASTSFNGGEISPLMKSRTSHAKYLNGCDVLKNMICIAQGSATRRPGMLYVAETKDQVLTNPVRIMPFVFSSTQSLQIEVGVGYFRFLKDDELVEAAGVPYEVVSPYTADDVPELWIHQSNDVIFIASRQHAPAKLSRFDDDDWTFSYIDFIPVTQTPVGITVTNTTTTDSTSKDLYKYVITAINDDTGEESSPSEEVTVTADLLNKIDGNYNTITWTANTVEPLEYKIYKYEAGIFGYIGTLTGSATTLEYRDDNINADTADSPPSPENPFADTDQYPGIVFGWEQRLGWAGSNDEPFNIWLSPSAQFESMSSSTPPDDDDALTKTLAASMANRIQWVAKDRALALGTTGNEWSVGTTDGEAMTVSSGFTPQGECGSEAIPPITVGESLIFVQRGGDVVREFIYTYASDSYQSNDASIISSHLLDGKNISEWCVQLKPFSVVWMVLSDGGFVGMTHVREHEVVGWHQHETSGDIESICWGPGTGHDNVYFIVTREIDGVETRFIERFGDYFIRHDDAEDAFHVDCGSIYDGVEVEVATALAPHLAGETVEVWADGAQQPDLVVPASGDIALTFPASKVVVGLSYVSEIRPTRPEVDTQTGTTMGRVMKVNKIVMRLYKTISILAGPTEDELSEPIMHDAESPLAPAMVTGDVECYIDSGFTEEWGVIMRSSGSAPMTVTAVLYDVEIGGTL